MVADLYERLLQELAPLMQVKELKPDQRNSCVIKLKSGLRIQIEMDKTQQFLIVACDLGEVPSGRYRENILREALKANDLLQPPVDGIFAFSNKAQHLILFTQFYASQTSGEKIYAAITPFIEKAQVWTEALKRGETPVVSPQASRGTSMFGLR